MSVLAIDVGTTGVTALVVTEDGRVASRGYQEFPQHFPRPGWVEHEPEEIWQAVLASCREALRGQTVTCVGITDQRETAVLWDKRTLAAPRRAIVWQDRRTTKVCDRLQGRRARAARRRADRAAARPVLHRHQAQLARRARPAGLGGRHRRPDQRRHRRRVRRVAADRRPALRHRRQQRQPHPALRPAHP
jgi:sugar (pentulose or hexulose) kinase